MSKDSTPPFVISAIKSYWKPGMKILEIGCGPAFLRKTFGMDYIGSDITSLPYYANLARDVDLVCSADNLLLSDAIVNIVVIKSAFFLFPNHTAVLREVYRVLKPGGMLFIFDYNKRTQKDLQRREKHTNYPCWSQWSLKKLIKANGFIKVVLLVAEEIQPTGLKKVYRLIKQELRGDWVIVFAVKN